MRDDLYVGFCQPGFLDGKYYLTKTIFAAYKFNLSD